MILLYIVLGVLFVSLVYEFLGDVPWCHTCSKLGIEKRVPRFVYNKTEGICFKHFSLSTYSMEVLDVLDLENFKTILLGHMYLCVPLNCDVAVGKDLTIHYKRKEKNPDLDNDFDHVFNIDHVVIINSSGNAQHVIPMESGLMS